MNTVFCGASKIKITPSSELLPQLYGLSGIHFAGVIDDLYVRALAIGNENSKALLVSWDLDKAPNPDTLVPALSQRTGVPEDNILYFGVHTHTAPMHSERPYDGPNARSLQDASVQEATLIYEAFLEECLMQAADAAISSMRPAALGWSVGKSYIGENRVQDYVVEDPDGAVRYATSIGSNPYGEADHDLFLLRADDMDGNPVAFFINHAVHCCTMIMNNYDGKGGAGISADIAGQVSTLLEERYPGSVALWSSGAAGDINPVMMNQYNYADENTGRPCEYREFKTAEPARLMLLLMSRRHFADILAANRTINCNITECDISAATGYALPDLPDDPEYSVRLRTIKIGNIVFCGVTGELFGSLGKIIKNVSPFEYTVIVNHDSSLAVNSGYIFDDDALERCMNNNGSLTGLPGMRHTPLRPGYLAPALKKEASELFLRLKG